MPCSSRLEVLILAFIRVMLEAAAYSAPRTWLLPRLGPQLGAGLTNRSLQFYGFRTLTDRCPAVTPISSGIDHDRRVGMEYDAVSETLGDIQRISGIADDDVVVLGI